MVLQVEKAAAHGLGDAGSVHLDEGPQLDLEESEHAVGNIRIDKQEGANQ